jgi:hypothetical protein
MVIKDLISFINGTKMQQVSSQQNALEIDPIRKRKEGNIVLLFIPKRLYK